MANNLIVCGGTFDHLHKGHKSLLRLAFSLGGKVIIGVTSDNYLRKSKIKNQPARNAKQSVAGGKSKIEEYEIRKSAVEDFLEQEGVSDKGEIISIDDVFGPTLDRNLHIDTIVASKETKKGAEIINEKRKELRLKKLNILIVPQILAEDGKIISAQRIRNGKINRMGRLYVNPLWLKKDLILPENLREEFQKPFGELLKDEKTPSVDKDDLVIAVGDVTTRKFNENSIRQRISVIDFRIARRKTFSSLADLGFSGNEEIIIANNPAGHITCDLFSKVLSIFKSGFNQKIVLEISGEEDLTVLPLILAVPLNTIIYYGQPGVGLVKILVSEEKKEQAYSLVLKFRPIGTHTRGY